VRVGIGHRLQDPRKVQSDVSLDEIFDAFLYYYEFDAFKEFD
jgi:hypothetical protein